MIELEEIWILHESGTCLFNYAVDEKMNPALFGGFFTAINQFGQKFAHNSIDDITMGENFLMTINLPEYHVAIVGRTTHTRKRKTMGKLLHQVSRLFQESYSPSEVINWGGNLSKFEGFKTKIDYLFNRKERIVEEFRAIF